MKERGMCGYEIWGRWGSDIESSVKRDKESDGFNIVVVSWWFGKRVCSGTSCMNNQVSIVENISKSGGGKRSWRGMRGSDSVVGIVGR